MESEYKNSRGKIYPCYSLNRDGMLQMLNSESTLVRYKTIEYINDLEEENRKLKEGQELISAHKEIRELKNTLSDFRRLTEEAKATLKMLRFQGKIYRAIAKELNCSVATVHKIINEQK